jgi:hypothetical protein
MDKQIDARFDRMDKALSTLLESIARYNPTSRGGDEFLAADAELSKGLEECTWMHQLPTSAVY